MIVTINLFKGKYLTTYLKSLFGISFNMSSFSNPNVPSTPPQGFPTSVNGVNDSAIHKDSPLWESRNHFLFISSLCTPTITIIIASTIRCIFVMSKFCTKHFTCIIFLNFHGNPPKQVLFLASLYGLANLGLERLSNIPKVIQAGEPAGTQTQVCLTTELLLLTTVASACLWLFLSSSPIWAHILCYLLL